MKLKELPEYIKKHIIEGPPADISFKESFFGDEVTILVNRDDDFRKIQISSGDMWDWIIFFYANEELIACLKIDKQKTGNNDLMVMMNFINSSVL